VENYRNHGQLKENLYLICTKLWKFISRS